VAVGAIGRDTVSRVSVSVDPREAELPLPGGRVGATVTAHPLLTGETLVPPALFERPPGRFALLRTLLRRSDRIWIPIPAYLVLHPIAGPLLVDTGFHPSVAVDPTKNLGLVQGRMAPIRMEPEQAASHQLASLDLRPAEIRWVVLTHLHYDHASAISEFPDATFVVSEEEWYAAAEGGVRQGYRHRHFDHAFDWRTIDFDGPAVNSFSAFGRAVDLFGDGSVRLLYTPGHTLGHMSVLLRLAGRELLLAGDAVYDRTALERDVRPLFVADEHLYRRSVRELRRFIEQTPGLIVVPGHDPRAWAELDAAYA
jgi:N-acyl homoserine lactone hydrolase